MKDSRVGRFTLVPSAISFLLGGGLVLVLARPIVGAPPDWMTSPEAPAWVQAIGSIAAIGVAIWVPAWQRRKDRQAKHCEQELQAAAIAGALQPFVHAYRRRAQYLASQISLPKEAALLRLEIPEDAFDLPPTVQQFHPSFYLLGEDAEIANKFVASLFWLQQAGQTIHHGHLFDETRNQIELDCANTVRFAKTLGTDVAGPTGS